MTTRTLGRLLRMARRIYARGWLRGREYEQARQRRAHPRREDGTFAAKK